MNAKNLALIVCLLGLAFCRQAQEKKAARQEQQRQEEMARRTILRINDASFSNRDLQSFIQTRYSDTLNKGNAENGKLLSRLFDLFVDQQLIQYAARQEHVEVSPAEIAKYREGLTTEKDVWNSNRQQVVDLLRGQKYLWLKVYGQIVISDKEIIRYYLDHQEQFRKTDEIFLYQILLNNKEQAVKVREEVLNRPGHFAEIARQNSLSPEAAQGGEMGYFEKGVLPKELEDVVFSLRKEEISPVVESPYGFHIFKVTKKKKGRLLALANAKEEIRNKLLSEKMSLAYQEFLTGLKGRLPIQVSYEKLFFPYQTPGSDEVNNDQQNPAENQNPAAAQDVGDNL